MIDDHRDWRGKANYMKAAAEAMSGRMIPADYEKPSLNDEIIAVFPLWAGTMPPAVRTFAHDIGEEHITAIVTSMGSRLRDRKGFKNVIDLVGNDIKLPEDI